MENVKMTLVLPDINRNKRYKSERRAYEIILNGALKFKVRQDEGQVFDIDVPMGSLLQVVKRFDGRGGDSVFAYKVGDATAILRNQKGKFKQFLADLDGDVLFVYDDNDFNSVKQLTKEIVAE